MNKKMLHRQVLSSITDPIPIDNLRAWIGITQADDNSRDSILLEKSIAAMQLLETMCDSVFTTREINSYADNWNDDFLLVQPVQSVVSFKYKDTANVEHTLVENTDYFVDTIKNKIVFSSSFVQPELSERPNPIVINYIAGNTTLPNPIREAIYITVGRWEIHQQEMQNPTTTTPMTIPNAALQLLSGYRDFRKSF